MAYTSAIKKNWPQSQKNGQISSQISQKGEIKMEKLNNFIAVVGGAVAQFVATVIEAARRALDMILTKVLLFLAFVALLSTIITYTGLGKILGNTLVPLASSLWGLMLVGFILSIPIISSVAGPGAVVAQILSVLIGTEIGAGNIPPSYALPALYAIDVQVGCDFMPASMSMMDTPSDYAEAYLPAILFSRWITGVIAVFIGWLFSLGMY
jgi:PTS system glucitol/sorbitol-specific IIB component